MLLLGVLQAQAAGGGAAGTFELIEQRVLTSAESSVTFSSLSTYAADYQHLQLRIAARSTLAANLVDLQLQFNADAGANYVYHQLYGNGSSVASEAYTGLNQTTGALIPAASATANSFGASVIDILDAFETTKFKTIRGLSGYTANTNYVLLRSGLWRNTAATTDLSVYAAGGNLAIGTRISLYGIKAA